MIGADPAGRSIFTTFKTPDPPGRKNNRTDHFICPAKIFYSDLAVFPVLEVDLFGIIDRDFDNKIDPVIGPGNITDRYWLESVAGTVNHDLVADERSVFSAEDRRAGRNVGIDRSVVAEVRAVAARRVVKFFWQQAENYTASIRFGCGFNMNSIDRRRRHLPVRHPTGSRVAVGVGLDRRGDDLTDLFPALAAVAADLDRAAGRVPNFNTIDFFKF